MKRKTKPKKTAAQKVKTYRKFKRRYMRKRKAAGWRWRP